ncbi:transporter substrate-binding domain-containing protein [Endozoicomonas sp. SM1973]|uniref:Transporter substrate-binding domain-containing protein n=1 Tax=Spartinivicinus marinus TaxID=2994442 RepID=A0A853IAP3_9GAMM|nr:MULTISPECIES: transporter substrate-binding domain-containing protein [Spartinivicinus]MCX4029098.1 transporter substrate-binding domain-containing protein [Spartinivicinus marinus]NYZ67718.1 transporter substrate-binding domain-containing protein [Spartinivicinus marinus]
MRIWLFLVISLSFPLFGAEPVNFCDDEAGWPPYYYHPRVDGKPDRSKIVGFNIDLMKEVEKITGLKYTLELMPWKRCLDSVANFDKEKKYEAFMDGTYNKERAEKYYLTTSVYETHEGIWFSQKKYPDGIPITKFTDLNNFSICTILGYNSDIWYEKYQINKTKKFVCCPKDPLGALKMVSLDRCDLLISSLEPIFGSVAIGQYTIPKDIKGIPLIGAETINFYWFVSKKSPRAYELTTKYSQAITILKSNGVAEKILRKYIPK